MFHVNCQLAPIQLERTRHLFSFICNDPGVRSSRSIRGFLEYYEARRELLCIVPTSMPLVLYKLSSRNLWKHVPVFEPMPLHQVMRRNCFSLQFSAGATVCDLQWRREALDAHRMSLTVKLETPDQNLTCEHEYIVSARVRAKLRWLVTFDD